MINIVNIKQKIKNLYGNKSTLYMIFFHIFILKIKANNIYDNSLISNIYIFLIFTFINF